MQTDTARPRPCAGTGRALAKALPAAALAAGLAVDGGCTPPHPADPLVARCGHVLRYEQPDWSEVEILGARRDRHAVTLRVEGVVEPDRRRVSDSIECAFRPGGRAAVERVVIGDRALGPSELALVNAELLLLDLGGGATSG